MWPFDEIDRLERRAELDRPAAPARAAVHRLLDDRKPLKDALHGVWLGHPLHPVLVQVTLGSLLSASLVDLVGGRRSVSSGLIATGLLLTPPTVAAGAADWSDSNPDQQRVGVVHAAANGLAVTCYAAALVQRARGRSGRVLSLLGAAISTVGATLGGHLAYHQSLGPNHTDRVRDHAPQEWRPLGRLADLPDGAPVRRDAGEVPVFVLRRGTEVTVLANSCPHLSAPLSDGEVTGSDGDARIVCPWHGSEFSLTDGCVVHGPATAAVPVFAARVVDGGVQARIVESAGAPTL
ncbi:Rieske (2Fe-2S) protein [Pseudonocardia kunmingensis]|uniref:Nitrite reductase/ring-hydroxylating ferredoxin subunit n=1 Tax=Pseudonocardia kunmingensis TaxID=630975 RepID=A0A543DY35_9PSEU|nr:Rieske (2Fe-2S) protein [Pseudonocardia kunmingensis]TQM14216.1 nitrite reductase/ring-hydroxylating ferredoxin subunit [Pseudonocardia kunmingensis]